jgi:hypothetical protein
MPQLTSNFTEAATGASLIPSRNNFGLKASEALQVLWFKISFYLVIEGLVLRG